MSKYIPLAFILASSITLFSQSQIVWEEKYGGSSTDFPFDITRTNNGGYVMVGLTLSGDRDVTGWHGWEDYWVVKVDKNGKLVWQRALGGTWLDVGWKVETTADDGVIIAGWTASNDGDVSRSHGNDNEIWIVKLDSTGSLEWEQTYGGTNHEREPDIIQTSDGGYLITAKTNSSDGDVDTTMGSSDCWVFKINSTGTFEWGKNYGGSSVEIASFLVKTEMGFVIGSSSLSSDGHLTENKGGYDYWIFSTDSFGNIIWQRSLGSSEDDYVEKIIATEDGGFIVGGFTYGSDGDVPESKGAKDIWIVKLNEAGEILWNKTFGGSGNEHFQDIRRSIDGNYTVTGVTYSKDGDLADNDVKELGASWIIKIDAEGRIIKDFIIKREHVDVKSAIEIKVDNYILMGAYPSPPNSSFWIASLDLTIIDSSDSGESEIRIWPNPVNDLLWVESAISIETLELIDITGKSIFKKEITYDYNLKYVISVSKFPAGIYFLKAQTNEGETFIEKVSVQFR